jgi:hypothetical protein
MSLSLPEIDAQVRRVMDSGTDIHTIAIRAGVKQAWPETLSVAGRDFVLRWCESSLAIREALCEIENLDLATSGLVVLTPLATHQVAEDVAARLARARVYQPEGWDIVRQMFQAKETDSRLGQFAWMPQTLIDCAAQGHYDPVANGFLDLETAWRAVLQRLLGFESARPDAVGLLSWSVSPSADARLLLLPQKTREDVLRWLGHTSGVAGEMVLGCVAAGRTADAIPLGLVCSVIFNPLGEGETSLGQAAVRLERFADGKHVGISEGRAWAKAANEWVKFNGPEASRLLLERADTLLRELRADDFVHLSDWLPNALEQRLAAFAKALSEHTNAPSQANLLRLEALADSVLDHHLSKNQKPRAERVEMARRLARWLMCEAPEIRTFQGAVAWQSEQGAFVDWARFRLLGGDELPALSEAYNACRSAVIARRNTLARPFADALLQWNANQPASDGRVLPVESVLEQLVTPLSAEHPVLLLVMDGLSTSIYQELFDRMDAFGWSELVPASTGKPMMGVAALPTITEVSRASLLCGRLTLGAAAQEKSAFGQHAGLLSNSRPNFPPRLFHKGDLAESTNLSAEVRTAIANPQQKVVGVVYNAVDDHLSGPDQLNQRWSLEDLRLLLPLLREARDARRVVVVTADHGHLLEDGTTRVNGGDSDRWRMGESVQSVDEIAVSGRRVVTADGSNKAVCLWGESTRYAGKKNGYHGGLSPQEVTVPLSVMAPMGLSIPGWVVAPPLSPEWWELAPMAKAQVSQAISAPPPKVSKRKPVISKTQPELFDSGDLPPVASPAPTTAPETQPDWIADLFASKVYASQRQLAARVAPPDEKIRLLLSSLAERGGKMSRTALTNRLSMPEMRMGGFLSSVRRVLSVDQVAVLTVNEAAATVELNLVLLQQQFGLIRTGDRT